VDAPLPIAGEPATSPARRLDAYSSCGRARAAGRGYAFRGQGEPAAQCLRCNVRHRPIVRKAAQTALVVGTVLTAMN
jgi:hypothetical protein